MLGVGGIKYSDSSSWLEWQIATDLPWPEQHDKSDASGCAVILAA